MKCPSCSYERCETDEAPEWQCPSCQRAYNKHPDFKNASLQKPTEIFQKHKHTILLSRKKILVLALVVVSLLYLYIKKNDTIKPKVTINNEFQELGNNRLIKAKNQESDFNKYHVDLYLLSSKSYTAYELIKDCKNSCQQNKTSSCTQVNLILNSINPQVERLNQYSRIYGFSNLTKEQNILKDQIYINLNWISKEIEITNSICGKTEQKNSNIKTTNTKKIVTSDFGINLGKIQSDINVKRNFLEKCANYCITFGHKDVNCVAYNEYSEKTSSDYEDYITLVNKHGLQAFTNQEQSVILLIDREVKACSEYINLIRKKCENNN